MNAYTLAKERYAALGVDTEAVLETLKNVTVSVHCWQGHHARTAHGGLR